MAFPLARNSSHLTLSTQELFDISQEIGNAFAPIVSKVETAVSDSRLFRAKQPVKRQTVAGEIVSGTNIKLSQQELIRISHDIDQQFAPQFDSAMSKREGRLRLSAQEILAINEEISREFAPKLTIAKPELVLLPVDPHHLHAYWQLDGYDVAVSSKKHAESALTLRIYSQSDSVVPDVSPRTWFDVTIDKTQGQQKIALPLSVTETRYTAAIGEAVFGHRFTEYACSNVIYVPRCSAAKCSAGHGKKLSIDLASLPKHASGQGQYIELQ